jgi:hypothetical protein
MANNKKIKKHALSYEQAQHAFLSLTADTYGKISDDSVRFLWIGLRAFDTSASVGSALGCSVKEGWDWLIMFLQDALLK